MDNFLLQPHYFLSNQSLFWRKRTSCVAVLGQNTCVYCCRLVLYHLNFNISSISTFMQPGRGIMDGYLLQPYHFLPNQSLFLRKVGTSFVSVLAQNIGVWVCRPVLYYFKVNISLLGRLTKPEMRSMDTFLLQSHHFLSSQSPFWRKTDPLCCCSGPKHMCV